MGMSEVYFCEKTQMAQISYIEHEKRIARVYRKYEQQKKINKVLATMCALLFVVTKTTIITAFCVG